MSDLVGPWVRDGSTGDPERTPENDKRQQKELKATAIWRNQRGDGGKHEHKGNHSSNDDQSRVVGQIGQLDLVIHGERFSHYAAKGTNNANL